MTQKISDITLRQSTGARAWQNWPEGKYESLRQDYENGIFKNRLAEKYDVTEHSIERYAKEGGWTRPIGYLDAARQKARLTFEEVVSIYADYMGNMKLREIKAKYHISNLAIGKLIDQYDLTRSRVLMNTAYYHYEVSEAERAELRRRYDLGDNVEETPLYTEAADGRMKRRRTYAEKQEIRVILAKYCKRCGLDKAFGDYVDYSEGYYAAQSSKAWARVVKRSAGETAAAAKKRGYVLTNEMVRDDIYYIYWARRHKAELATGIYPKI